MRPIARLRGRCRYQLLVRSPDRGRLRGVAAELAAEPVPQELRVHVDVDPVALL